MGTPGDPVKPSWLAERRYVRVNPAAGESQEPRSFNDYADHRAIVVLGEPGMGKTTAFRHAAQSDPQAVYYKVGTFLHIPSSRLTSQTLYLDALDEHRRRLDGGMSSIDRVMGQLLQLNDPRFRLSCRVADWYGASDVASLGEAAGDAGLCVLRLLPLTDNDVIAIASAHGQDGPQFLRAARSHGVAGWLGNPLNLKLVLDVVQATGWPASRAELFDVGVTKLVQEQNPDHARANQDAPNSATLDSAAGYVCAVLLLSGMSGVALSPAGVAEDMLDARSLAALIGHAGTLQQAIDCVLRSRMFAAEGMEQVIPVHRALAEYAAARFLVERVRQDGLPYRRVLALLEGFDGRPPTELRGLFAWFTALLPEHADMLISTDPVAMATYGDAALLTHDQRVRLLAQLESQEPFDPGPVSGWGSPDMEPVYRGILADAARSPTLRLFVLSVLQFGTPMPGLQDVLMEVVRTAKPDFLQPHALDAYQYNAPGAIAGLRTLLQDIQEGRVLDPGHRLRGELINMLYPAALQPVEILDYLIPEGPNDPVGAYNMAVEYHVPERTPIEVLPDLLDALVRRGPSPRQGHRRTAERLVGHAIVQGLARYGETEPVPRVFEWLGLAHDDYENTIRSEEKAAIREWFTVHPAKHKELILYWLAQVDTSNRMDGAYLREVQLRVQEAPLPSDFTEWALPHAVAEPDDARAVFLFRLAVLAFYGSGTYEPETLVRLYAVADDHPRFAPALQEMSCWPLDDTTWKWRVEAVQRARTEAQQREERINYWMERLEMIRRGSDMDSIAMLALYYFGHVAGGPKDDDPMQRLRAAAGDTVSEVAVQGFVSVLSAGREPRPREVAALDAQNRGMWFWYVPIAGMEVLHARNPEGVVALPDAAIGVAVATALARERGNSLDHPWMKLLAEHKSEAFAKTLLDFWTVQLEHGVEHLPGTFALKEDWMREVTRGTVPALLRRFPNCAPSSLDDFMEAALQHCDEDAIRKLALDGIGGRLGELGDLQLARWYSTAYMLSPVEVQLKLQGFVATNRERAGAVLHAIVPGRFSRQRSARPIAVAQAVVLLEICASQFKPVERGSGGWVPPEHATTEAIQGLITHIAREPDPSATAALAHLEGLPSLTLWGPWLSQARSQQLRLRRDAEFRRPLAGAVIETLAARAPANAADFQALVLDCLLQVKQDIEHGPTDRKNAFWNTDSHGRLRNPKVENEARDRILDALKPMLAARAVAAEREGDYARHRCADIKCVAAHRNLPIEVKRQHHADVWTAALIQLHERYSRDPGAEGHGIYLVLWYGELYGLPAHPEGRPRPTGPPELKMALGEMLPESIRRLVDIVVVDVSAPIP